MCKDVRFLVLTKGVAFTIVVPSVCIAVFSATSCLLNAKCVFGGEKFI